MTLNGSVDLPTRRHHRRALVITLYGLLAFAAFGWSLVASVALMPWLIVTALAVGLGIFIVLYLTTRHLADQRRLDEREASLRDAGYTRAYHWLGLALLLVIFLGGSNSAFGLPLLLGVYLTLPTAILAWLEPDPILEDPREAAPAFPNHQESA